MSWKTESRNLKERESDGNRITEERIRDLKRRIEELRNRLYPPQSKNVETVQKVDGQRSNLEEASEAKRNAELDAIRQKLRRKL